MADLFALYLEDKMTSLQVDSLRTRMTFRDRIRIFHLVPDKYPIDTSGWV